MVLPDDIEAELEAKEKEMREIKAKRDKLLSEMEAFFPNEDFKQQAASCIRLLLPKPGSDGIIPTLLVLSRDEDPKKKRIYAVEWYTLMIDGFNDYEVRSKALRQIGEDCAARNRLVVAVFLITEAWISQQDASAPRQYQQAGDDPNRREVAICAGKTIDGRGLMASAELTRNRKGKIKSVGDVKTLYDLEHKGLVQAYIIDEFYDCYHPLIQAQFERILH